MLDKAHRTEARDVLLGDEAVALGALHAGISAAYGYPGTPSTEILEYLIPRAARTGIHASWCANEKSAYEAALGASMAGRRALVTMKHVGLNVAADPFVNSALVALRGGLVVAVADDPGMHSSQDEQDSRMFADIAHIPCLEPGNQQEAYELTREAFVLSERWRVPVMVRLVTRLCHSRAVVASRHARPKNPARKAQDEVGRAPWILLPAHARRQWRKLLTRQAEFAAWAEETGFNTLWVDPERRGPGVLTAGLGRNYFLENLGDCESRPSHLHVATYPLPVRKIRRLAAQVDALLVVEDGFPWIERQLRGLLPPPLEIRGKLSGHLPEDGELTPENVRAALGLAPHLGTRIPRFRIPPRPPRLCDGCPHADSFAALRAALDGLGHGVVTGDIGCYTLGALPPYEAIDSCVCMGASVGMAKGAADAGIDPAIAVIGDSTFLHSGIPPLLDAIAEDTNMTLVILDNEAVAMTGGQPSLTGPSGIERIVRGLGADPAHCHVCEAHPKKIDALRDVLRRGIEHDGLSVVITVRECIQAARARRRKERRGS